MTHIHSEPDRILRKYEHEEAKLELLLGVSRDALRDARDVIDAEEWISAREIMLTEKGVRDLVKALGVELPEKRAKNPGDLTMSALLDLTRLESGLGVQKLFEVVCCTKNSRVLMAAPLDGGEQVRVWVHDSCNFLPGMKLMAEQEDGDLWRLVGRCPRFRGRW